MTIAGGTCKIPILLLKGLFHACHQTIATHGNHPSSPVKQLEILCQSVAGGAALRWPAVGGAAPDSATQ